MLAVGPVAGVDLDLGAVGVVVPAQVQAQALVSDSGVVATPEPAGATVQVNDVAAEAPAESCAVTVTVDVPAAVGVPVMVPLPEIDVPAGSPDAVNASDWPLLESAAETFTDTAVPAVPSCGPGLVMVTGWPSCADVTASVPVSGRFASESPTAIP